jgi:hypothetical protein
MGIRGELFSTKVALQNRTYFFNVKENRLGDLYLNIVESKNRETGGFERQSVILFADDLAEFLKGFDESLRVLEKAVREKRRGRPGRNEIPGREAASDGKEPPGRPKKRNAGDGPGKKVPRIVVKPRKKRED